MLLEYFDDPSLAYPVLLLWGDNPAEAAVLRQAANGLATGRTRDDIQVDGLPGFRGVDGCSLVAQVGESSLGIEPIAESAQSFRCVLSPADWQRVSDLLEPFATTYGTNRFQYLSEQGGIEWIISADRGW
jgi:hypothetical protein